MGNSMPHQDANAASHNPGQQNKSGPGELGAKDPSGKLQGGLEGQQTGQNEAGQGDNLNLEQQNRLNR